MLACSHSQARPSPLSKFKTEPLQPQRRCTLETLSPVRTHTYWKKKSMKEAFGCITMCESLSVTFKFWTCHKLTSWIVLLSEIAPVNCFIFVTTISSHLTVQSAPIEIISLFVRWLTDMKAFPFPLPVVHSFMFKPWPAHWKANSDPGRSIILKTWQ